MARATIPMSINLPPPIFDKLQEVVAEEKKIDPKVSRASFVVGLVEKAVAKWSSL